MRGDLLESAFVNLAVMKALALSRNVNSVIKPSAGHGKDLLKVHSLAESLSSLNW